MVGTRATWKRLRTTGLGAFILLPAFAACGGSPSAPAAPSVVQVAGPWQFAVRITEVTGGDCINPVFAPLVGRVYAQTLTLQQEGSAVTGRVPATVYGVDCNLTGTSRPNGLSLGTPACMPLGTEAAPAIPVACPSGGELMITSPAVTADITMSGGTGTGTYSETFSVTSPGGQQLPQMTISGSVTMTRQ